MVSMALDRVHRLDAACANSVDDVIGVSADRSLGRVSGLREAHSDCVAMDPDRVNGVDAAGCNPPDNVVGVGADGVSHHLRGLRETIGRQRCRSAHVAPVSLRQSQRTGS